jgi:FemAB-related protein (PEP-CTERM system-associated)
MLFGRFLVSLPFVNYGGVVADDEAAGRRLIEGALELSEQLDVRYLEVRHEHATPHPSLIQRSGQKVHMRLDLPGSTEQLWNRVSSKVRNQVRKAQKCDLTVAWGRDELLQEFYEVFSRNMRDLGTPVYGSRLFRSVLRHFPDRSEFCIVRTGAVPVAAALVLHGWGVSEVPSASSLRLYNHTCANMLLYWHVLERAVQRGQAVLDFGRSNPDSNTYRFKKQWGATPVPAEWQYHLRRGGTEDMRPDNPRYARFIRLWQRLPVWLTRRIGPRIVRGIP